MFIMLMTNMQLFTKNETFQIFDIVNKTFNSVLADGEIVPFSEDVVNGEEIDDKSDFAKLVSEERIKHIEKAIKLYKSNDYPVKGLIFCSRVE